MKKIEYYRTSLKVFGEGIKESNMVFTKSIGYYYRLIDGDIAINVVFERINEFWSATHLESGLLLFDGYISRRKCLERVIDAIPGIVSALKLKSARTIIRLLENFRAIQGGDL